MPDLAPSAHTDTFTRDNLPKPERWPVIDLQGVPETAAYPERMNCATELLDKQAETFGDRPAFYYNDETWTYSDLLAITNRIANTLVDDLGIVPGNRVMLRAPNNPMYVACWFAVMKVGAVAVATMPLLRWRELKFMSEKARIELAICDKRLDEEMENALEKSDSLKKVVYFYDDGPGSLESLSAAKPETFNNVDTAADDCCLIAFTSGTTGDPKGCMHFHSDILAMCDTFSRHVLKPTPDDVFTGSPPVAFTFGLGAQVAFPMHAGASTVLVEQYTPELILQTIRDRKVTILFTAPVMYRAMTELVADHDISSLQQCVSAGETLPQPTWEGWHDATGLKIIDGLGSTEMIHIFVACAGDDIKPGATGKAIPGYRARVTDDNGNDVPPNTVGRLAVQGPTGCKYLDNDERQQAYVQDGWNYTGDAYLMDEQGYLYYQARTDDMIISAGYNISGPEIEAVMMEHPDVLECGIIGAPDEKRGHIVKAFVVLREGVQGDDAKVKELQDFVKAEMAPYKYPRAVEFIDALPRTETGKVQRFKLRDGA